MLRWLGRRAVLEKLIVSQLVTKFPEFMKPELSILCPLLLFLEV
jgi:hypothetical protein